MEIDRRKAMVFGAAAALRLLLFTGFSNLPNLLGGRVEISTPVSSFKRCGYGGSGTWQYADWYSARRTLSIQP